MFLREVTLKRKTGPDAVYVQLVHNDCDPEIEQSRTRILHSFGRKEELDTDQLRRLKEQCEEYLPPLGYPIASTTPYMLWGVGHG